MNIIKFISLSLSSCLILSNLFLKKEKLIFNHLIKCLLSIIGGSTSKTDIKGV